ncbi:replication initiator [Micromonospora sp. LZ34]
MEPRLDSRAARMLMPRSIDVVADLAADHGVCTRPVALRRTDLDSGQTEVIDLPCGATQEAKCPACATRAPPVLRAISERIQWRVHLDAARRAAAGPPDVSATSLDAQDKEER